MSDFFKRLIIIILLAVVVGLCWYKFGFSGNNVNILINQNEIKKEYSDKELVFNATYSTSEKIFPYVNIDSNAASSINFQIKKLYETNNISKSSYKYFINGDNLSVLIDAVIDDITNYYTFNINTLTGKEIRFEDVYPKYTTIDITIKNKLSDYISNSEVIQSHLDEVMFTKEYVVDTSYNTYKINSLSNNVKFFMNEKNELNVVVKIDLKDVYYEYAIFTI